MKQTEPSQFISSSIDGVSDSASLVFPPAVEWPWWKRIRRFFFIAALAGVVAFVYALTRDGTVGADNQSLIKVVRGDMEITVLEGGNIKALESLELKSQVKSREGAKILFIIDEGYEVTSEDVKEKKVLIKLDPTEMKEKIEAHDIDFENAQAAVTETDEERSIQATESQNEIKLARQTARFALLDLEKYLGEEASDKVLDMRSLPSDEDSLLAYEEKFRDRLLAGMGRGAKISTGEPGKEAKSDDEIINRGKWIRINFAKFLEEEKLGDGEAQQELRKRQDELLVAQSEYAVAEETVLGSERLSAKSFITKTALDKEKLSLKKAEVKELSAKTQLELFRRYEFPKQAEEFLTKYQDALHLLDREKKEALAKLSQADAKFRSAEQMFKMANRKRDELNEQLASCTITATKPGLVVYGSSERTRSFGGSQEKIEEGASVRYKQTMITIPDMRRMGVKVSIQESQIKKVKAGQKVRITTDAEPDKILSGEVNKVAVLPDSNRWFENPNQKVYPTEIHIDGTHDWLKPGMSAKVEIVIEKLQNVLLIPLQAVMVESGETLVYVNRGGKPARQAIKAGSFNEEFIEITGGLSEGDPIYLSKPSLKDSETVGGSGDAAENH